MKSVMGRVLEVEADDEVDNGEDRERGEGAEDGQLELAHGQSFTRAKMNAAARP